jgi:tRNA (guanine37-N1)-methyltransferase
MPLPALALDYIPYALEALRRGEGWLHVYLHVEHRRGSDPLAEAARAVYERVESAGWRVASHRSRKVRSVGPRRIQVVVDARVEEA